jgi:hypothetical protein
VQYGRTLGLDYKTACDEQGMMWGLWDAWPEADHGEVAASFEPAFYICQAEQAGDTAEVARDRGQKALAALRGCHAADPSITLALVTDLGPSRVDPTLDPALQELDASCLPESYLQDNPAALPDVMCGEAYNRGYSWVVCTPGAYYGYPLANYRDQHGVDACCVWVAETLSAADWTCWGGEVIGRVEAPPPPRTRAELRAKILGDAATLARTARELADRPR